MARKSRVSKNIDRWVRRHQGKHLCLCGCGNFIFIERSYHKASVGIPKYIHGHNLSLGGADKIEEEKKASSWDLLTEEERQQRLSLLKTFGKGEDNPSWKGGRVVNERGYIQVRVPEHPMAVDGYVFEHRLVVEEHTRNHDPNSSLLIEIDGKKYLRHEAVVHHIDENKQNNDISNLMLLPNQTAHVMIHKSKLPMDEILRRISLGIFHSYPLTEENESKNNP